MTERSHQRRSPQAPHPSRTKLHKCYILDVTTIGLRELRQQASEIMRRVEAGEAVTITVSGRPSARLVPVAPRAWRRWDDLVELFSGRPDDAWADDFDALDGDVADPWIR